MLYSLLSAVGTASVHQAMTKVFRNVQKPPTGGKQPFILCMCQYKCSAYFCERTETDLV